MPYVHLASPGAKQVCPNSAACWSPSAAAMRHAGQHASWPCRRPRPTTGSPAASRAGCRRTPAARRPSPGCARSISMVRLALVTSVTCTPPSGRRSGSRSARSPWCRTAPRRARPRSRRPGVVVEQPAQPRARRSSVASGRPRALAGSASAPAARPARRRASSVRVSCQTIGVADRHAGVPVPEHRRLALVGDAERGDLRRRSMPACAQRLRARAARTLRQISTASCSTQPGFGKCCWCSCWATDDQPAGVVEQDAPGRGGALVDGHHVALHHRSAPERGACYHA